MTIESPNQKQNTKEQNIQKQNARDKHHDQDQYAQKQLQLQIVNIDPNERIGVVPKPRPAAPPRVNFEYENYKYDDEQLMIDLPIRPDSLTKQDEQRLCNILKKTAIDLEKKNNNQFIAYCRSYHAKSNRNVHHGANTPHNLTADNNPTDKADDSINKLTHHGPHSWWQAGGNSALFYHYRLEKSHKLTPVRLRSDTDYGCKWPNDDQVVMIQNIDHIITQLCDKVHAKFLLDTPEFIVLELPIRFSPEEIESLRKIRQHKQEAINKLLLPEIVHPHTHQSISELHCYLANRVFQFTEPQRIAYGYTGLELIKNLSIKFRLMSNGAIPAKDYYVEALAIIDEFCSWLLVVQDIRLIDTDSLYQLIIRTNRVKENITNELQQLQ